YFRMSRHSWTAAPRLQASDYSRWALPVSRLIRRFDAEITINARRVFHASDRFKQVVQDPVPFVGPRDQDQVSLSRPAQNDFSQQQLRRWPAQGSKNVAFGYCIVPTDSVEGKYRPLV